MADSSSGADPRSRILGATLELVGREGLGGLTNRKVAAASGVSLGTLTYHFPSQQMLLREALERFLDEELERLAGLTDQLASAALGPEQGALALEAMLRTEPERRVAKIELYLQAWRDPDLRGAGQRCFAAYDSLAATAFGALDVEGAEELAPMLVAVIDGLQLRRLASGGRELQLADSLRALITGLRTERGDA